MVIEKIPLTYKVVHDINVAILSKLNVRLTPWISFTDYQPIALRVGEVLK